MEMANKIECLATKLVDFIYGTDYYHANDCGGTVTEIVESLWDSKRRKGIAADLKGYAEWHEDDAVAYEASMLYREVVAL